MHFFPTQYVLPRFMHHINNILSTSQCCGLLWRIVAGLLNTALGMQPDVD